MAPGSLARDPKIEIPRAATTAINSLRGSRSSASAHRHGLAVLLLGLLLLGTALPALAGEGWPRWRGPSQDGTTSSEGAFAHPELGLEVVWSRSLGSGYAGVSVLFGVALTAYTDGDDDVVVALEAATGNELWRHVLGPRYDGHDGSHDGPLSTPVVADGRVFALAPRGRLVAIDLLTGEPTWEVDLAADLGAEKPYYGFTTTPLILGDVVIVELGGEGEAIVALDVAGGEKRWGVGTGDVTYQSAIAARLAGEDLVLATTEGAVIALDPKDGSEHWRYTPGEDWDGAPSGVVVIPDDRLLLYNGRQTRLLRVGQGSEGATFDELWTGKALRSNWSAPVYYDEHLYGYAGRFLTCVRADDGESVWKSRPPAGLGLVLVDDQLVLGSREGGIVVVAASPEGYVERARVDLAERASYTSPTFAGGLVFHRDLETLAALRPVAAGTEKGSTETAEIAPRTAFERFLASLEGARNPGARVSTFLAAQGRPPLVEGGIVHFLYRGPVDDVGIGGTWLPERQEVSMERVAGTDLFFHTVELPEDARVDYWLTLDFESAGPDPSNPRQVANIRPWSNTSNSELRMPGFEPPPYEAGTQPAGGVFETFELESAIRGNSRDIEVYRPAGLDEEGSHELLVMTQGESWLGRADLPAILDRLAADTGKAPLVAFVGGAGQRPWQETGGAHTLDYTKMLAEELLPALEERYSLAEGRESKTLAGSYDGGTTAILAGLAHPGDFGRVIALSPEWHDDARLMAEPLLADPQGKARFAIEHWTFDEHREAGERSMAEAAESLVERLTELGFEVVGAEQPGGSGWGIWGGRLAAHLAAP